MINQDGSFRPPPKLRGYSYDANTIFNYRDSGKLLCLRLDLSYRCNLHCKYCYTEKLRKNDREASFDEIIDTIEQGIKLGMKSVILLGGEPMIYDRIYDFLSFLLDKKIIPVMFTNTMNITSKIARRLYDLDVTVMTKFDGFKESQDSLSGQGTFENIQRNLNNLISVGFNMQPDDSLRLGSAAVVTAINYNEIPQVWRFLRKNNIFPNMERMTVQSSEKSMLGISVDQVKKLMIYLKEIDKKEFGIKWDVPYSAIPAHICSIFYAGCHVNPYREVSVCPELPPIESLRRKKLAEILSGEYFQKARHIDKYIRGQCAKCPYLLKGPCYGCRSKVFYRTNSLFNEDEDCYIEMPQSNGNKD